MANIKNLVPNEARTPKQRRENASKAGKASGEARRKKKELRECIEILLETEIKAKNGEVKTGAEALTAQLFKKAMAGDVRAFEVLRDTAGQKPIERVQIAEVSQADIDAVEQAFND